MELQRRYPTVTVTEIARLAGCSEAWVRQVFARAKTANPTQWRAKRRKGVRLPERPRPLAPSRPPSAVPAAQPPPSPSLATAPVASVPPAPPPPLAVGADATVPEGPPEPAPEGPVFGGGRSGPFDRFFDKLLERALVEPVFPPEILARFEAGKELSRQIGARPKVRPLLGRPPKDDVWELVDERVRGDVVDGNDLLTELARKLGQPIPPFCPESVYQVVSACVDLLGLDYFAARGRSRTGRPGSSGRVRPEEGSYAAFFDDLERLTDRIERHTADPVHADVVLIAAAKYYTLDQIILYRHRGRLSQLVAAEENRRKIQSFREGGEG